MGEVSEAQVAAVRRLSVIIPVYNEINSIGQVIDQVVAIDVGVPKEIIVVDDGSTDGTGQRLAEYQARGVIAVHTSRQNFGKGTAIRVGLRYATGDVVLIQDADLEYDVGDYPALLAPFFAGRADVVYGSRFLGSIRGMRPANRLANYLLARAVGLLFGQHLSDEATAYKLFRAEVLRRVQLNCIGFEFCPEVTAKVLRAGYRIHEVPVRYQARSAAEGKKVNWRDGFTAVFTLLRYRFRD
ncbi:MAG: glycosyltransferase family 2 protein [Deltaproteobacteria bacterium]|nr:glycosyltransferase family 2 protein [Deltaproteobacteria bacterium]MBI3387332.1 glycosyltransferase family 2 protein [Deltaproteobacteria bacterium]